MLQKLLLQCRGFSQENWWIYILLSITIGVVIYSWKWNFVEIIILFVINLLWAMCNMLMMSSYKNKKFAEWSVFIVTANMLYTLLSLYAWIQNGDLQYLFWQFSFLLTWFKAYMLYTYNKDIQYINFITIFILNTFVILALIQYVWITMPVVFQSLGIFLITLGLALKHDTYRYFIILFWNIFVVGGTLFLLWENYISWNILWITVAYMLLWLSTLIYYFKLLPIYISRYKLT